MCIQRDTQHNTPRNTRKYFSHRSPPFSPFISFGPEDAPSDYHHNTITYRYHLVLFIPVSSRTPFLDRDLEIHLFLYAGYAARYTAWYVYSSTIGRTVRIQRDTEHDTHTAQYTAWYAYGLIYSTIHSTIRVQPNTQHDTRYNTRTTQPNTAHSWHENTDHTIFYSLCPASFLAPYIS